VSNARASLERLGRFGITPNRELGQNFLADDNMLDVIGRLAELSPEDVILEIGGGLGVLSSYLAARVGHLHVVEVDGHLEAPLADALAGSANTDLLIRDVMDVDLASLRPQTNKVVANLPYGVAVPAILKTIAELPATGLWCVMVQREIADRLAAPPANKTYGIPSVLVQVACDVKLGHVVSRNVFRPVPNVDSALVVMRRKGPAATPELSRLVHQGFAHRRKKMARSLRLAGAGEDTIARVLFTLQELGYPADVRAERVSPQDFQTLAEKLAP